MATHTVQLNWLSGVAFEAHQDGKTLVIDGSADIGGQDLGLRPKALMLTSLAGCTGIDVAMILEKKRVSFSMLSIAVRATINEGEPSTYQTAVIQYSIKLALDSDRDKMEKAVALSQEKYCGVAAMFRTFAELSYEIVYL
jgi:putative redox protein